jgi:hypothetical protein
LVGKSIAAAQEFTRKAPDLCQVGFGMVMAKGFADTNSSDGTATNNGQSLRGPSSTDQR